MDGARLNFSHGSHADHGTSARLVRDAQDGVRQAACADRGSARARSSGSASSPSRSSSRSATASASQTRARREPDDLPVAPAVLGSVLAPEQDVLVDDGHVRLRVERVEGNRAMCRVITGGIVEPHKGVNVPGVPLPVPSLTEKDLEDLDFALGLGVDYVAQSFVRSRADVAALRAKLETAGSQAWVIAKIELQEAVAAIDEILDEADAVMIARGDLGVEVGAADVPLLQKRIILAALERGKPAITATQMLESMVHRPEPTRAEASDVANAILDGTSAVMLSAETAIGEYPVEAVETMAQIALAVEPSLGYRHQLPGAAEAPTVGRAMSNAACDLAEALGAKAILVPDLHRTDGLGRRATPPAQADRRADARRDLAPAHGDRMGRHAARDSRVERRRRSVASVDRDRSRRGDRGRGRPRRPHRRHRGEHSRLDQRDQGRRRVATLRGTARNPARLDGRGSAGSRGSLRRGGDCLDETWSEASAVNGKTDAPAAAAALADRARRPLGLSLLPTARLVLRDAQRPRFATGGGGTPADRQGRARTSPGQLHEPGGDAARGEADRLRASRRAALRHQGDSGVEARPA